VAVPGVIVTLTGAFTVRLSCLELLPNALAAQTVKATAPCAVGVPLMRPVEAFNVRPAGGAPVVTDHVIGVLPEAVRFCAYFVPASAAGKAEVVVIEGGVRGACENAGRERVSRATRNLPTKCEVFCLGKGSLAPVSRNTLPLEVLSKHARLISAQYIRSVCWHPCWFLELTNVTDLFIGRSSAFF